jgi:carbohydrate diacid regulator
MLTASLAHEIACENAAVTGLGILITDRDGEVIGSSDPKRLGTCHEASLEVVRTREPASHTARQAAALHGVKPGLTLPILVDGEAVGTVGITGSPARVRRFGPLVRRHTEILLRESATLRSQLLLEAGIEDLIRDIASFDPEVIESAALVARARELGYTLDVPRIAIVFAVSAETGGGRAPRRDASVLRAELVRVIRERFADADDIVAASTPGRFVVLHRLRRYSPSQTDAATTANCAAIVEAVRVRYSLPLRAAVGGVGATLTELRLAMQDASDAMLLAAKVAPTATTYTIRELRPHQLLSSAGHRARSRLIATELAELRAQGDWEQLRTTLIAWCEAGFNLVAASARLHIHRNTLIYRIAKIEQITGRSLRDHAACITTYLACLADQIEES